LDESDMGLLIFKLFQPNYPLLCLFYIEN